MKHAFYQKRPTLCVCIYKNKGSKGNKTGKWEREWQVVLWQVGFPQKPI